jgi:hypothetical protein
LSHQNLLIAPRTATKEQIIFGEVRCPSFVPAVRDPSLFGVLFVATALTAVNDICLEGSHPSFEGFLLTTDTHSFKIDWFISWKEKDECYEQQ